MQISFDFEEVTSMFEHLSGMPIFQKKIMACDNTEIVSFASIEIYYRSDRPKKISHHKVIGLNQKENEG